MNRQVIETLDREATRAAWIGMVLFFACGAALPIIGSIAAVGMTWFLMIWVGSAIIAIRARRLLKS